MLLVSVCVGNFTSLSHVIFQILQIIQDKFDDLGLPQAIRCNSIGFAHNTQHRVLKTINTISEPLKWHQNILVWHLLRILDATVIGVGGSIRTADSVYIQRIQRSSSLGSDRWVFGEGEASQSSSTSPNQKLPFLFLFCPCLILSSFSTSLSHCLFFFCFVFH